MRRTLPVRLLLVLASLILVPAASLADVRLPAVLSDHMVLQQGMQVPVWGWADAGEEVAVQLGDLKAVTRAGADGTWKVAVGPLAAGGPLTMTVAGKNTITVSDILVGEVWVCSGQSNMAWTVANSNNAQEEIAAADFPQIRLITVARVTADEPQADTKGSWAACSPQTVGNFSAAGYFFGRKLHKDLGVPVGLISSNWGGTRAEAWTSAPTLKADPMFAPAFDQHVQSVETYVKNESTMKAKHEEQLAKWKEAADKAKAEGKPAPRRPGPPQDPRTGPNRPCALYNGMITPLIPFAIRGAIWYQGESNAGKAYEYRRLFPLMIQDWRRNWGQGDFTFLFVQLANFMARKDEPGDSAWAELREAQSMTLSLPKTGQAVIIDIGEEKDIHPKNKQDVGARLALAAEAISYGKDVVYSGPVYKAMKVDGGKAVLTFEHIGGGLVAKGDKLAGFAIAGEDRKFVWADARIEGDTVVVSSDKVAAPVAVRYAWADNPDCNLYNKAGLPASPFRTDQWPGVTAPKPQ
jgi:sialate O-acetylesterase